MSERLFLALETVKGHDLKIFGKLGAQRRTEAIARARELGLIEADRLSFDPQGTVRPPHHTF